MSRRRRKRRRRRRKKRRRSRRGRRRDLAHEAIEGPRAVVGRLQAAPVSHQLHHLQHTIGI